MNQFQLFIQKMIMQHSKRFLNQFVNTALVTVLRVDNFLIHFSSTNPNFYSIRTDAQRNTLGPVWRIRIALEKSSANC